MVARLQKEKNQLLDDSEKNKNDADLFHSQIMKYQREKEKIQAELDLTEERFEKAQSMFKKTQVKTYYLFFNNMSHINYQQIILTSLNIL